MEQKQYRPNGSMGMFDLYKGVAIISVVVFHTLMYYLRESLPRSLGGIIIVIGNILLNGFVVVAGYGVRKKSSIKCFRQIRKAYLVPYIITAIVTPVLFFIVHIILFKNPSSALVEARDLFLGLIFGQYPTYEYFGHRVYSCGPIWFVVALSGALFLFNLILNHANDKGTAVFVLICTIIGSVFSKMIVLPYCLTHIFALIPGLYFGYLARTKNLYNRIEINSKYIVIIIAAILCLCIHSEDSVISLAAQDYPAGPLSLIALNIVSSACVLACVKISRLYSDVINILEWLGHNSYYILCLHTVEYSAGNWYYLIEKLETVPLICIVLMLIIRSLFITAGMVVISTFKKKICRNR